MSKKLRLLFVTDSWHTLDHSNDTTLRLMQAALNRGHSVSWCSSMSIILSGTAMPAASISTLISMGEHRTPSEFEWKEQCSRALSEFHQIHYRTDPPVDLTYLHPLLMLKPALSSRTELVNPFEVLTGASEKLEPLLFPQFTPPTVVASQPEPLEQFLQREKNLVLKPLHLAQSRGIELLTVRKLDEARALLKNATLDFKTPVLLQKYLPSIKSHGETRLWWVDGKLLAYARKIPKSGEYRINMDQGGKLAPHRLSAQEKKVLPLLARHLKRRKIRLAAIDLIDGLITDFNFTSPGLLVGLERVSEMPLADKVMKSLEK